MTRVGWVVLGGIVLVGLLFASVVRFGPAARQKATVAAPASPTVDAAGMPVLQIPVAGVLRQQITDTWGQARGQGRQHHGTDIVAGGGTPVLAAAAGTVEKLFQSRLGGTTLYQRSADGRWTFYYAHLSAYAPGVHEGQVLRAGDPIGLVGDSGDAGPGNYHLHFSVTRHRPGERWWQGEDVNPYPMLRGG